MLVSSSAAGYIAAMISILFFGSNFVPVKRIEIGDGIFYQFIMCNAIFITSLPVYAYQDFPPFHDLAMLGGAMWTTGNLMCGPIINYIGLSLGLLLWGSLNMLFGWASGAFGLFGLKQQDIQNRTLNYIGVCVALVGLRLYLMVNTTVSTSTSTTDEKPYSLLNAGSSSMAECSSPENEAEKIPYLTFERLVRNKRFLGVVMAIAAGALFGTSFNPSQYIIDNDYNGNDDNLNYVFPHFTGIIMSSWAYTFLYWIYMEYYLKKPPFVNPASFLPATLSGLMWGIACISWFYANGKLGFAIAFPLITSGPGFVASLWGIFVFKEISGKRDLTILIVAFLVTFSALVMIAVSH